VVERCLHGSFASREKVRGLLLGMAALARQDAALALRIAMLLAWVERRDLSDLGYSSFAGFCRERVDWRGSWLRDLVRLVESPLHLVKEAARRQVVPLRVAVRAPGEVRPEDQEAWLVARVLAPREAEVAREPRPREFVEGEEARVVRRARQLARVCVGRAVSGREVDAYILRCWADRVPGAQVLAEARERPPKPEWGSELCWDWCAGGGPADALVGPWSEPASVGEAIARIETLQAARRGRARVLARAWALAEHECLWMEWGFDSARAFARELLGWSASTAARYRRIGWTLRLHPEVDAAVRDGFDLQRAELLGLIVGETDVRQWLAVAGRVGRLELRRAVRDVKDEGRSRPTLQRYARAIAAADAWWAVRVGAAEAAGSSAGAGGAQSSPVGEADGSSAGAVLRVALPHPGPEQLRGPLWAPPGLVEAARWFLEEVKLPAQWGFGRVKERDGYRCGNPECGRLSLRNEGHHLVMRSQGGSDAEENGVTVCRVCHLRGIHGGKIAVERVVVGGAGALLWTYPGGRRVLAFREVPAWPAEGLG